MLYKYISIWTLFIYGNQEVSTSRIHILNCLSRNLRENAFISIIKSSISDVCVEWKIYVISKWTRGGLQQQLQLQLQV